MRTQQSTTGTKRDVMTDGLRYLARELVREPVKSAVKEALREEAVVKSREGDGARGEEQPADEDGSGGLPVGLLVVGLATAAGVTYFVRKRRNASEQSTWSEFDEQSASGSVGPGGESSEHGPGTEPSETDTATGESGPSTTPD